LGERERNRVGVSFFVVARRWIVVGGQRFRRQRHCVRGGGRTPYCGGPRFLRQRQTVFEVGSLWSASETQRKCVRGWVVVAGAPAWWNVALRRQWASTVDGVAGGCGGGWVGGWVGVGGRT
jgi:hypothetical protein